MVGRLVSPALQASRSFAAQAAVAQAERELVRAEPMKISTLKSGLSVASVETFSPVATLGVVVKAGSRNEEYSNAGISHTLRVTAGLGTKTNSAFGICRNLQQVGARLQCTQGREHTLYTVQTTRDNTDLGAELLADVVSGQAFKPWEVERSLPRMKLELAQRSPASQAVELVHQAAYRTGLGNSLYCPGHKVGTHGTSALLGFTSKHFTAGRAALLGIGVGHSSLAKFGELVTLEAGAGPAAQPAKYHGGEVRQEVGGGLAYVALAANCAGAVSVGECVAAMLLQRVLGMGGHVKYSGGQGQLARAAAASSGNYSVAALGQMYSDSGLLGAMVVAEAAAAGKVVAAVAQALRTVQVTEEEVAAAKRNMLADVYTMLEAPLNQIENMGSQILLSGEVMPPEKVPELIAGISAADVQAAAKKLSSAKLSLGAVGNLSTVPHIDSL